MNESISDVSQLTANFSVDLLSRAAAHITKLRTAFPRRKFKLVQRGLGLYVEIEDTYLTLHVKSKSSVYVSLTTHPMRAGTHNICSVVAHYLKQETTMRRRHTHLRCAMRDHIEALQSTELLGKDNLVFTMSGFGGGSRLCPEVNVAFSEVPDGIIATIQYNRHHNRYQNRGKHNNHGAQYTVWFGEMYYHFETWQGVCDLFNGCTVFTELDTRPVSGRQRMVRHDRSLQDKEGRSPVFFQSEDLAALAPYLLVMECCNFVEYVADLNTEAKVRPTLGRPALSPPECELVRDLYFKSEPVQFLRAFGHTELAWDGSLAV